MLVQSRYYQSLTHNLDKHSGTDRSCRALSPFPFWLGPGLISLKVMLGVLNRYTEHFPTTSNYLHCNKWVLILLSSSDFLQCWWKVRSLEEPGPLQSAAVTAALTPYTTIHGYKRDSARPAGCKTQNTPSKGKVNMQSIFKSLDHCLNFTHSSLRWFLPWQNGNKCNPKAP